MEVNVNFKNKRYKFSMNEGALVSDLNEEIEKQLQIKPENQKIILRGKALNNPSDPLTKGMKLLLMEQANPIVINDKPNKQRQYSLFKPSIIDTLRETYHQDIIKNGAPEGHTEPIAFSVSAFPSTPIYVRNNEGVRCAMSVESDAICLISDDLKVERFFFSDITRASSLPIPGYEGFLALGMITKAGNKWIYFIPQQFRGILKSIFPN